ncbi:MAG: hypothetical protein H6Q55_835 [Deltaproteobacteria bacterium]|nr:hypothetical protein [Deltaproteobacteria bacterium]
MHSFLHKRVACLWDFGESHDQDRRCRSSFLYPSSFVIDQGPDAAENAACHKRVMDTQGSLAHHDGANGAMTFVKA